MNNINWPVLLNRYPILRRIAWIIFAIIFYLSGERFTLWLFEPERLYGPGDWVGVVLFPALLVLFFFSGRYLGCSADECATQQPENQDQQPSTTTDVYYQRPPGL